MQGLWSFFSSIRWQDVVDIVLNSYILFRVYALFRGTRVFHILVGISIFWVFHRLAVSLGLILTSWAMQGITAAAALIIIVVFRNEIRSVLQAKTLKAILWGLPQKTEKASAQSVVDAIFELAERRIGALIVFPGKEALEDVVQSGISWQGAVTKEMVMSIFWPGNPVHDGAAIVEGDTITEVGAILPLSRRDDLPSHFGTRHRAAIGLAESSDALALLASEEKGYVFMAKGSQMQVALTKPALQYSIEKHLGIIRKQDAAPQKERWRLTAAAVVSFLFIGAIWFSFTRGFESLVTLEVPIEYMYRAPEMEIVEASVDLARVSLGGSGALIKSVRPGQVQVRLDLSKAVVGTNLLSITPENVTLPPGVVLKEVKPRSVEVVLDVPTRKTLPVQVDWAGKLPPAVTITDVAVIPASVTVIGGKQIVDGLSTIYTETVSLAGISDTGGTMSVKLALESASVKLAPGFRDSVLIKYLATRRTEESTKP